jgi:hypothetical protein
MQEGDEACDKESKLTDASLLYERSDQVHMHHIERLHHLRVG